MNKNLTGAVLLCAAGIIDSALNKVGAHNIPSILVAFCWIFGLLFIFIGILKDIKNFIKNRDS